MNWNIGCEEGVDGWRGDATNEGISVGEVGEVIIMEA